MLLKQASKLPLADAEPRGQRLDAGALAIARAVGNQREAARYGVGRPAPGAEIRRSLRPASQTGTEACLLRRCG